MSLQNWKQWVVYLAIAVLALPFIMSVFKDLSLRPEKETRFRINKVFKKIKEFKEVCGAYPETIAELMTGSACEGWKAPKLRLRDSWGQKFEYTIGSDGHFTLTSFGKGGRSGGSGMSADIVLISRLSENQLKEQTLDYKLKAAQIKDGFIRIQCQNRPEEGMLGQSDLHVVVRRSQEDTVLRVYFVKQTWRGSRSYAVEVESKGVESGAKKKGATIELVGPETKISLRRVTRVVNKWRGELEAIVPVPKSDSGETVHFKEILICRVRDAS